MDVAECSGEASGAQAVGFTCSQVFAERDGKMLARRLVLWFVAVTVPGMLVLGGVTFHSLASLGSLNEQLNQITLSLSAVRDLQFALIAAGDDVDAYLLRGQPRQRAAFERMIGTADQKLAGCGAQSCHGASRKPGEMAWSLVPAVDRLRAEAREMFERSGPFAATPLTSSAWTRPSPR